MLFIPSVMVFFCLRFADRRDQWHGIDLAQKNRGLEVAILWDSPSKSVNSEEYSERANLQLC